MHSTTAAVIDLPRTLRLGAVTALAAVAIAAAGCASLPTDYPRSESRAWPHPEQTAIGRSFADRVASHPDLSGVRLLSSGIDAFAARVALADRAERTLDLQYYMVRDDDSTNALLSRIVAAAQRGVLVRVLIDDLYAVGRDFDTAALSAHPGIEVRVFNPFLRRGPFGLSRLFEMLGDTARLNHRMHNKLFVADSAAAVVGGRNLGNEYFGAEADAGFVDLDLLVVGPVVKQVAASFDEYWASEWAIPIEAFAASPPSTGDADRVVEALRKVEERLHSSDYATRVRSGDLAGQLVAGKLDFVWARAQAIYDRPTKVEGKARREAHIRPQLRPLFEAVRSDVFFVSPYFVPGEAGVVQLRELRNRGVSVRVLTNSLAGTDVPAVYAGYSNYRVPLLDAGVELFELRPVGGSRSGQEALTEALGASRATLHAKTFVVDRRYVFVGSMNLDARSDLINTEFGLLIDSEAIAEQLLAQLARLCAPSHSYRVVRTGAGVEWITEEEGRELRTRRTPDVSPWRRIQAVVLSVLAPEELL